MNLSAIKQIAQAEMGDKRSHPFKERGNKYTHGERVAKLALRLRQIIAPEENDYDDILTVAAWFHDICNGSDNHAAKGAERTLALLKEHCAEDDLEQICGIIAVHDDRNPGNNTYADIIKIHQDADHLDHFGTFDIWMVVAYTIGHDETINEAVRYLTKEWPNDNARWRSELHFDLSIKIFDEKTEFVKSYTERFAVESAGGIYNEETLTKGK